MATIRTDSKRLIREEGSKSNAEKYYSDWYDEICDDRKNTEIQKCLPNEWFKPGKMYTFKYSPKFKQKLHWWDRHPLVLSLGQKEFENSTVEFCINLHLLPYNVRIFVLDAVYKRFRVKIKEQINIFPKKARKQKPLDIGPEDMGFITERLHLDFAARNYRREKIRKPYVICYEDWSNMMLVPQHDFVRITERKLILEYRKHVRDGNKK